MEGTAVKEISLQAAIADINQRLSGSEVIAVPKDAELQSLERFRSNPNIFRGKFITSVIGDFVFYLNTHGNNDSGIFINPDTSSALAIIDLGDQYNPLWGKHRAGLYLKKTAAYAALLDNANTSICQLKFIDFIRDWKDHIAFDGLDVPGAIKIFRKLTVKTDGQKEQTISNFAASASALEKIEIKAGADEIPEGFHFKVVPHEGFNEITFDVKIQGVADEKSVRLKYRISQLEIAQEVITNEFRDRIRNGVIINGLSVFIGDLQYQ